MEPLLIHFKLNDFTKFYLINHGILKIITYLREDTLSAHLFVPVVEEAKKLLRRYPLPGSGLCLELTRTGFTAQVYMRRGD